MWPFGSRKLTTLSHACLAGDLRAAKTMLAQGADPNAIDPGDDTYPIFYALNSGPEMVQLLLEHGADVNVYFQRRATPLAIAESKGMTAIVTLLRNAGARLRTDDAVNTPDLGIRLQLEPQIRHIVRIACRTFPKESPEFVAQQVEGKLNLDFPKDTPLQEQERTRKEVRALILQSVRGFMWSSSG